MSEVTNRVAREGKRAAAIPEGVRCARCGATSRSALRRVGRGYRCGDCDKLARGQRVTEAHHVLGRAIDPETTVPMTTAMHREMEDTLQDMGVYHTRTMTSSGLDLLILAIQTALAFAKICLDKLRIYLRWLLGLRSALVAQHGSDWESALRVPAFHEPATT